MVKRMRRTDSDKTVPINRWLDWAIRAGKEGLVALSPAEIKVYKEAHGTRLGLKRQSPPKGGFI